MALLVACRRSPQKGTIGSAGHPTRRPGLQRFEYVHGKTLTPRNAMDKAMRSLQGFGDELHREQSSERTHAGTPAERRRVTAWVAGCSAIATSTCIRAWTPKTAR